VYDQQMAGSTTSFLASNGLGENQGCTTTTTFSIFARYITPRKPMKRKSEPYRRSIARVNNDSTAV